VCGCCEECYFFGVLGVLGVLGVDLGRPLGNGVDGPGDDGLGVVNGVDGPGVPGVPIEPVSIDVGGAPPNPKLVPNGFGVGVTGLPGVGGPIVVISVGVPGGGVPRGGVPGVDNRKPPGIPAAPGNIGAGFTPGPIRPSPPLPGFAPIGKMVPIALRPSFASSSVPGAPTSAVPLPKRMCSSRLKSSISISPTFSCE
jgi:hypothetical protein